MRKSVLVIGGGWTGIYALKHALEHGLEAELVEKDGVLMGVWHCDKHPGGVIQHTHATSSIAYMQPSDFPFPEGTPEFPRHNIIYDHIIDYVKHFKLGRHIRLRTSVKKMKKRGEKWVVTFDHGQPKDYDHVIVATGMNSTPSYPDKEDFSAFRGKKIHSHDYHKLTHAMKGKRILIVGGGETACDIAKEIAMDTTIHMSIRSGQLFQRKIFGGAREPADMLYNRFVQSVLYQWANHIFSLFVYFIWGTGGSGIKEWKPKHKYLNGIYNKSSEVITLISQGEIEPHGKISGVRKDAVRFDEERSWTPIDMIIFATGYNPFGGLAFLPTELRTCPRYKLIFASEDTSIAFAGFIRPFLGSIPMLAELQTRFIAQVFSGETALPKKPELMCQIHRDQRNQKKEFPQQSGRLPMLVSLYRYCNQIGVIMRNKPRMLKLLITKPKLYWKVLTQPWSPFQWRIHDRDPEKRRIALEQIDRLERHPITKKLRLGLGIAFLIHTIAIAFVIQTVYLLMR